VQGDSLPLTVSSAFERFFSLLGVDLWLRAADNPFGWRKVVGKVTPTVPKPRLTPLPCAVPRSHEGQYLGGIEAADSADNRYVVWEHSDRPRHAQRFERNT
jgi:hypothetical protein